jgi:hypothetical protein
MIKIKAIVTKVDGKYTLLDANLRTAIFDVVAANIIKCKDIDQINELIADKVRKSNRTIDVVNVNIEER